MTTTIPVLQYLYTFHNASLSFFGDIRVKALEKTHFEEKQELRSKLEVTLEEKARQTTVSWYGLKTTVCTP